MTEVEAELPQCPSCGEALYGRPLVCPYCGAATPLEPAVRSRRPEAAPAQAVPPAAAPPPVAPGPDDGFADGDETDDDVADDGFIVDDDRAFDDDDLDEDTADDHAEAYDDDVETAGDDVDEDAEEAVDDADDFVDEPASAPVVRAGPRLRLGEREIVDAEYVESPRGDADGDGQRRGALDIAPAQPDPGPADDPSLSVIPTRGGREVGPLRDRRGGSGAAAMVIGLVLLVLLAAGGFFLWQRFGSDVAEAQSVQEVDVSRDWRSLDLGDGPPDRWTVAADGPFRLRVDGVVYTVSGPIPFAVPLTGGRVEVRAVDGTVKVTATLRPE